MNFHWIDILLMILLLVMMFSGFRQGFTGELFRFFGVLVSVCFAFKYTHPVADLLYEQIQIPIIFLRIFSFVAILTFCYVVLQFVKLATQKYGESTSFYMRIEKIGGLLVGFVKGFILSFVFIIFLLSLPFQGIRKDIQNKTYLASGIILIAPHIFSYITVSWKGRKMLFMKRYLKKLSQRVHHPLVKPNMPHKIISA